MRFWVPRDACISRYRRTAIIRLVGAVLGEQHDDWIEGRRYLGLDVLTRSGAALTNNKLTDHNTTMTPAFTA